jgi:hypothetical protein
MTDGDRTMKYRFVLPAILVAALIAVQAQEPSPDGTEPAEAPDTPVVSGDAPAEIVTVVPEPEKPSGDRLTLKSGQVIEGLQILRENSAFYVLEIIEGITLDIPRRQVVSIEYDDIDPILGNRKPTMIRGQRLSDRLETVLDTDISDPPFEYQNADLIQVLNDIRSRVQGSLTLDPSIEDSMPPATRAWTVSSEPGLTLGTLLRKELLVEFPDLVMVFENDAIVLTTKAAASVGNEEDADVTAPEVIPPVAAPVDDSPPAVGNP